MYTMSLIVKFLFCLLITRAASFSLTLKNNRHDDMDIMHVMLTGVDITGLTGITAGVSTKWSDLTNGDTATITMDTIRGGRLYVALGQMPSAPVPSGSQYYGWIEFTKTAEGNVVWINLTNVDVMALPISIQGTNSIGSPFALGYQSPVNTIASRLESVLVGPSPAAKIITATGQVKIVAPNIIPESYRSFDSYIQSLCDVNANIVMVSETPTGGSPVTFTGMFRKVCNDSEPIISMTGSNGKVFQILKGQLTTSILYRCDGGTLIYDGQTYNDNSAITSPTEVITNSVFRNICIGFNEGYFTPDGENDSSKFTDQPPFQNNQGSEYARIIHEHSNSYGFAYADKNLKVLETADPFQPLSVTILKDDQIS